MEFKNTNKQKTKNPNPTIMQKKQCGGVYFDNTAWYIECQFDKNSPLQRYFFCRLGTISIRRFWILPSLLHCNELKSSIPTRNTCPKTKYINNCPFV